MLHSRVNAPAQTPIDPEFGMRHGARDTEHPVRVDPGPAHKAVTHQVENPMPVLAAVGQERTTNLLRLLVFRHARNQASPGAIRKPA